MKIISARFITSATRTPEYPKEDLPQVAFAGRSNVGKSSLINRLVDKKDLAKISSIPGKTRTINFFSINDRIMLVDLPGYGYARVSKQIRQQWRPMVEEYLAGADALRLVIIIVDIRRGPEHEEESLYAWLSQRQIPCILAATKSDKERKTKISGRILDIAGIMGTASDNVVPFSARTGFGKDALWSKIREYCGA
jgi:GTP-binding protein